MKTTSRKSPRTPTEGWTPQDFRELFEAIQQVKGRVNARLEGKPLEPAPAIPQPEGKTPETDAALIEKLTCSSGGEEECTVYPAEEIVDADFARRLERERDEARRWLAERPSNEMYERAVQQLEQAQEELKRAEATLHTYAIPVINGALSEAIDGLGKRYQKQDTQLTTLQSRASAAAEDSARLEEARSALTKIVESVPAEDGHGGLYVMHHDERGEELGPESVDPMAVISNMVGIAQRAIAAARAQPGQKPEQDTKHV